MFKFNIKLFSSFNSNLEEYFMKNEDFSAAVKVYLNAETDKSAILSEHKGKAGIYQWTHIESGKIYIGSAVNLSRRLKDYYSPSKLKKADNYICNALISHTHSAFSLIILEYIDISNLNIEDTRKLILEREQHFLDSLEPKYNIQKIAGSSLGQKRSEKTKTLISVVKSGENHPMYGKSHSIDTRTKISKALKGKTHSIDSKIKMSIVKGNTIYVYTANKSKLESKFTSARKAAIFFNVNKGTILSYCKNGKLLKDKWILCTSPINDSQ